MANSADVVANVDKATAAQYNNLRADVLNTSSGHAHDGTNARGDAQFILNVAGAPLLLQNTTDAVSNEVLRLGGGNRATPADNDELILSAYLDDDLGAQTEFGRITHKALDVTNTSKDSRWEFQQYTADTLREVVVPAVTADDTLAVLALAQTLTNKTIDSDNNTITNIVNADIKAAAAIAVNKLAALTASEIVIADGSGFLASAAVATYPSLTELAYVKGVTSALQTQIDAKGSGTVTPSSTDTFTNKTIDANGTGNVITNIGASEIEIGLITGQSELAAGPAETDEVLLSDAGVFKKINVVELLNPENFTAVTLPAAADELFINDAGVGKKITHDDLLFGANGTPSTQAHSDSAVIGTALDAARSDHKHGMPAAGGGGGGAITREGGNTTEVTTTSTAATDLTAITSLTIAAAEPFELLLSARKTSGFAADAALGLRLNDTVVDTPSTSGSGIWVATGTDENQNGGTNVLVRPRVTNYLSGSQHKSSTRTAAGGFKHSTFFTDSMNIADNPSGIIADVDVRGMSGNAGVTLGVDEQHVYSWATS